MLQGSYGWRGNRGGCLSCNDGSLTDTGLTDPEWDPEEGFSISAVWACGCVFHGATHKPTRFKQYCPSHPRAKLILVALPIVSQSSDEELQSVEASAFDIRDWPKGTFALKSPLAVRRMVRTRARLESELRNLWRPKDRDEEICRKIRLVDDLLAAAFPRTQIPSPVVTSIDKSA